MRKLISTGTLMMCLLVLATSLVVAAGVDDDSPRYDRRPITSPTVITEPGRYIVTNDLSGSNGERCVLTIAANNVDVDLGGFVLDGGEYENCLCASGVQGVNVANGTLFVDSSDDEPVALSFDRVARFKIRDVTVYSTADWLAFIENVRAGLIENIRFLRSGEQMLVSGSHITIRGCNLPKGVGLNIDHSTVEDNVVATYPGQTFPNGRLGVDGSHNRIVGNTAGGLVLTRGSERNFVQGNVFDAGSGIAVAGRNNRIIRNTMTQGRYGLFFTSESSDNAYAGNVAFGNAGVDCDVVPSSSGFCDEGTRNSSRGGNYLPDPR